MANTGAASEPGPMGFPDTGIRALDVGKLLDTVEFVKNAWSSFGVPSSLVPTTDLDELDRRIADMKTVEQWLRMNLSLLEASVQALEIQRGTIATLRAYGDMLGSQAQGLPGAHALAQAMEMAKVAAGAMPGATSPDPFSGDASIPATASSQSAAHAPQTPAAQMAAAASGEAPPHPAPTTPGLDAGAWWDLLHRQFNQIAAAALGAAGGAPTPAGESTAGAAETRKSRGGAPVARSRKPPSGAKTKDVRK